MGKQVAARINLKTRYRCKNGETDFAGEKAQQDIF